MNRIENKTFDEERSLYNLKDSEVVNVTFTGSADGESVLKEATIIGHVDSIKNPRSGNIFADSVGEIINEDPIMECNGKVAIRKK